MSRTLRAAIRSDINPANLMAGFSAILFYIFGAVPLFLGVAGALDVPQDIAASWFFIIFLTSGVSSVLLTAWYRQPIAVGWSSRRSRSSGRQEVASGLEELFGASLVAGIVMLCFGLFGLGEQLMRWMPLPIVLGMFAGSILNYVIGIFTQLEAQPVVVGAALAGFVLAHAATAVGSRLSRGRYVVGTLVVILAGDTQGGALNWGAPSLTLLPVAFRIESILAVSLPLVILATWTGTVPGLGVLASQGYRPPATPITIATGVTSIVNASFGGQPSSLQRIGTAMLAGSDAGPHAQRYVGSLIAGVGCIVIALAATTVIGLVGVLPSTLIATLAGLAILRSLMDALKKTMTTDMQMGALSRWRSPPHR